jgi:hypothetical protein
MPRTILVATATAQGVVLQGENSSSFQRYQPSDKAGRRNYHARVSTQNKSVHASTRENLQLNQIQRSMYRRLMYGLSEYTPDMLAAMSLQSILQVNRQHEQAQQVLYKLKVDRYFQAENKLLNAIFARFTKERAISRELSQPPLKGREIGTKRSDYLVKLPGTATLRKLGINTREICQAFISARLLPRDFFTLSPETVALP